MSDPSKMHLGGRIFRVKVVKRGSLARDEEGACDFGRGAITVKRGSGSAMTDTLIHEALHACLGMSGYAMTEHAEESVVVALTPWVHALIVQNPVLISEIIAGTCFDG